MYYITLSDDKMLLSKILKITSRYS